MTEASDTLLDRLGRNAFWSEIISRLDRTNASMNRSFSRYDPVRAVWIQESACDSWTTPVLLQNPFVAVDVTDHGLALYPLLLDGRYALAIDMAVFSRFEGSWRTLASRNVDAVVRRMLVRPGTATLEAVSPKGVSVTVEVSVATDLPLVIVRVTRPDGDEWRGLEADLWWSPGKAERFAESGAWLNPRELPLVDEMTSHNDSRLVDPPRPEGLVPAGIGVFAIDAEACQPSSLGDPASPLILADRANPPGVSRIRLGRWESEGAANSDMSKTILIGVAASLDQFRDDVSSWRSSEPDQVGDRSYWAGAGGRIAVAVPEARISRQIPYSVYSSLSSRTKSCGRAISVHGRRDRGVADVAHLHQSYQMHLVALAAGESQRVREEIVRFASLQSPDGGIRWAPRPGGGAHPYATGYTDAHLLLAAHRYVAWSGDASSLTEPVDGMIDGEIAPLIDRLERTAGFLIDTSFQGLMRPCGWLDAWPAGVRAQAQISITTTAALQALSDLCGLVGRSAESERYRDAAIALRRETVAAFYDPATGLFAEQLFDLGHIEGGSERDYWAHTQIWAALMDFAPDVRGLDVVRRDCLGRGMRIAPPSLFESAYVATSTDSLQPLPVDSTMTWLLAEWPELTHLYAMAEIHRGRVDLALNAMLRQLPDGIHESNPLVAPWYYPEKYLYPGNRPWLCTWGGDPTLVEVVLSGFFGVKPELGGLRICPSVPSDWQEHELEALFWWNGAQWRLVVDPTQPVDELTVDGSVLPTTAVISASIARTALQHEVRVSTFPVARVDIPVPNEPSLLYGGPRADA